MAGSNTDQIDDGIVTKLSGRSVPDTVTRFLDDAGARHLKIFAVIDQSAEARNVGLDLRDTVLVIFGNPAAGTPVMEESPLAALDLPLKVLIWSDDGQTKVSYLDPERLAARYGLSEDVRPNLVGIGPITDALVAG